MIKMMAAVRRKAGMTHAEFVQYVEHVHGELTRAQPGTLQRYVQNHVFDGAFGAKTDAGYEPVFGRDMIAELGFNSPDEMKANFMDPYTQTVIQPDGKNFNDLDTAIPMLVAEVPMDVPNPGEGAVKVIHYLKKAEGVSPDAYGKAWTEAHQAVLNGNPAVASALRKYVQSRPLPPPPAPPGGGPPSHFGGKDMIRYEGVASLWFDDEAALPFFREYEQALYEATPVFDPSKSFFVYAREVVIYQAA